MTTQKDRRERERIVRKSAVLHREYMLAKNRPDFIESSLGDVSVDGCSFTTDQRYEENALLELRLLLFGWEKHKSEFYYGDARKASDPLVALGRVASLRPEGTSGLRRIGVTFETIDESHQKALEKYLNKVANQEL